MLLQAAQRVAADGKPPEVSGDRESDHTSSQRYDRSTDGRRATQELSGPRRAAGYGHPEACHALSGVPLEWYGPWVQQRPADAGWGASGGHAFKRCV